MMGKRKMRSFIQKASVFRIITSIEVMNQVYGDFQEKIYGIIKFSGFPGADSSPFCTTDAYIDLHVYG